jgi:ADP-dependent NAD(P)H-hydrate dehydratase / NAD(P)H-hydrate epimerase
MKDIFYNRELLSIEKRIIRDLQIPSLILMENAGKNAGEEIIKISENYKTKRILILTGKGNNAGDGFVIARHLIMRKFDVTIFMLNKKQEFSAEALTNYNILENFQNYKNCRIIENKPVKLNELLVKKFIVVDSIYGIGFRGKLDKNIKNLFKILSKKNDCIKIAIDVPSGLDNYFSPNYCMKYDYTISMGVKKFYTLFYEGKNVSGKVITVDIGIPDTEFQLRNKEKIYEFGTTDILKYLPVRKFNTNKYSSGKTFILAGSRGFSGAAYLASLAALRAGSGAVILGIPKSLNNILERKTTEVITLPLEETSDKTFSRKSYDKILEKILWSDVTAIGPGIGRNKETINLILEIILQSNKNIIVDADGIFALSKNLDILKKTKAKVILTPHFGEFSNLIKISTDKLKKDFINICKKFSENYNTTIVLKNSPTIITNGKSTYINLPGKENLATLGSGDVLTGIIAGIFSQNKNPLQSALSGVHLHGLCGDYMFQLTGGNSTIASDLIDVLPKVKKQITDEFIKKI